MNRMIIDPGPRKMTRVYGIGNRMIRNAYEKTVIGKKYYLPVPWLCDVGSGRPKASKYDMLTCIEKYRHFAVFQTPGKMNVCFNWHDLAVEYSKGAVL